MNVWSRPSAWSARGRCCSALPSLAGWWRTSARVGDPGTALLRREDSPGVSARSCFSWGREGRTPRSQRRWSCRWRPSRATSPRCCASSHCATACRSSCGATRTVCFSQDSEAGAALVRTSARRQDADVSESRRMDARIAADPHDSSLCRCHSTLVTGTSVERSSLVRKCAMDAGRKSNHAVIPPRRGQQR